MNGLYESNRDLVDLEINYNNYKNNIKNGGNKSKKNKVNKRKKNNKITKKNMSGGNFFEELAKSAVKSAATSAATSFLTNKASNLMPSFSGTTEKEENKTCDTIPLMNGEMIEQKNDESVLSSMLSKVFGNKYNTIKTNASSNKNIVRDNISSNIEDDKVASSAVATFLKPLVSGLVASSGHVAKNPASSALVSAIAYKMASDKDVKNTMLSIMSKTQDGIKDLGSDVNNKLNHASTSIGEKVARSYAGFHNYLDSINSEEEFKGNVDPTVLSRLKNNVTKAFKVLQKYDKETNPQLQEQEKSMIDMGYKQFAELQWLAAVTDIETEINKPKYDLEEDAEFKKKLYTKMVAAFCNKTAQLSLNEYEISFKNEIIFSKDPCDFNKFERLGKLLSLSQYNMMFSTESLASSDILRMSNIPMKMFSYKLWFLCCLHMNYNPYTNERKSQYHTVLPTFIMENLNYFEDFSTLIKSEKVNESIKELIHKSSFAINKEKDNPILRGLNVDYVAESIRGMVRPEAMGVQKTQEALKPLLKFCFNASNVIIVNLLKDNLNDWDIIVSLAYCLKVNIYVRLFCIWHFKKYTQKMITGTKSFLLKILQPDDPSKISNTTMIKLCEKILLLSKINKVMEQEGINMKSNYELANKKLQGGGQKVNLRQLKQKSKSKSKLKKQQDGGGGDCDKNKTELNNINDINELRKKWSEFMKDNNDDNQCQDQLTDIHDKKLKELNNSEKFINQTYNSIKLSNNSDVLFADAIAIPPSSYRMFLPKDAGDYCLVIPDNSEQIENYDLETLEIIRKEIKNIPNKLVVTKMKKNMESIIKNLNRFIAIETEKKEKLNDVEADYKEHERTSGKLNPNDGQTTVDNFGSLIENSFEVLKELGSTMTNTLGNIFDKFVGTFTLQATNDINNPKSIGDELTDLMNTAISNNMNENDKKHIKTRITQYKIFIADNTTALDTAKKKNTNEAKKEVFTKIIEQFNDLSSKLGELKDNIDKIDDTLGRTWQSGNNSLYELLIAQASLNLFRNNSQKKMKRGIYFGKISSPVSENSTNEGPSKRYNVLIFTKDGKINQQIDSEKISVIYPMKLNKSFLNETISLPESIINQAENKGGFDTGKELDGDDANKLLTQDIQTSRKIYKDNKKLLKAMINDKELDDTIKKLINSGEVKIESGQVNLAEIKTNDLIDLVGQTENGLLDKAIAEKLKEKAEGIQLQKFDNKNDKYKSYLIVRKNKDNNDPIDPVPITINENDEDKKFEIILNECDAILFDGDTKESNAYGKIMDDNAQNRAVKIIHPFYITNDNDKTKITKHAIENILGEKGLKLIDAPLFSNGDITNNTTDTDFNKLFKHETIDSLNFINKRELCNGDIVLNIDLSNSFIPANIKDIFKYGIVVPKSVAETKEKLLEWISNATKIGANLWELVPNIKEKAVSAFGTIKDTYLPSIANGIANKLTVNSTDNTTSPTDNTTSPTDSTTVSTNNMPEPNSRKSTDGYMSGGAIEDYDEKTATKPIPITEAIGMIIKLKSQYDEVQNTNRFFFAENVTADDIPERQRKLLDMIMYIYKKISAKKRQILFNEIETHKEHRVRAEDEDDPNDFILNGSRGLFITENILKHEKELQELKIKKIKIMEKDFKETFERVKNDKEKRSNLLKTAGLGATEFSTGKTFEDIKTNLEAKIEKLEQKIRNERDKTDLPKYEQFVDGDLSDTQLHMARRIDSDIQTGFQSVIKEGHNDDVVNKIKSRMRTDTPMEIYEDKTKLHAVRQFSTEFLRSNSFPKGQKSFTTVCSVVMLASDTRTKKDNKFDEDYRNTDAMNDDAVFLEQEGSRGFKSYEWGVVANAADLLSRGTNVLKTLQLDAVSQIGGELGGAGVAKIVATHLNNKIDGITQTAQDVTRQKKYYPVLENIFVNIEKISESEYLIRIINNSNLYFGDFNNSATKPVIKAHIVGNKVIYRYVATNLNTYNPTIRKNQEGMQVYYFGDSQIRLPWEADNIDREYMECEMLFYPLKMSELLELSKRYDFDRRIWNPICSRILSEYNPEPKDIMINELMSKNIENVNLNIFEVLSKPSLKTIEDDDDHKDDKKKAMLSMGHDLLSSIYSYGTNNLYKKLFDFIFNEAYIPNVENIQGSKTHGYDNLLIATGNGDNNKNEIFMIREQSFIFFKYYEHKKSKRRRLINSEYYDNMIDNTEPRRLAVDFINKIYNGVEEKTTDFFGEFNLDEDFKINENEANLKNNTLFLKLLKNEIESKTQNGGGVLCDDDGFEDTIEIFNKYTDDNNDNDAKKVKEAFKKYLKIIMVTFSTKLLNKEYRDGLNKQLKDKTDKEKEDKLNKIRKEYINETIKKVDIPTEDLNKIFGVSEQSGGGEKVNEHYEKIMEQSGGGMFDFVSNMFSGNKSKTEKTNKISGTGEKDEVPMAVYKLGDINSLQSDEYIMNISDNKDASANDFSNVSNNSEFYIHLTKKEGDSGFITKFTFGPMETNDKIEQWNTKCSKLRNNKDEDKLATLLDKLSSLDRDKDKNYGIL